MHYCTLCEGKGYQIRRNSRYCYVRQTCRNRKGRGFIGDGVKYCQDYSKILVAEIKMVKVARQLKMLEGQTL